jgi:hypothetical protein
MAIVLTFGLDFCRQARIAVSETGVLGPGSHPDRDWRGFRWCKHRGGRGDEPGDRYEAPHFEDPPRQPCGCQDGEVATTRREAEPTQG